MMNKHMFICPLCETVITIQSRLDLKEGYTPFCAACSGRTISMNSDEYRYGKLA